MIGDIPARFSMRPFEAHGQVWLTIRLRTVVGPMEVDVADIPDDGEDLAAALENAAKEIRNLRHKEKTWNR